MTGYRITEQAADDIKAIWHYTASNHGEAQAGRYVNALKTGCVKIAKNPTLWRVLKLTSNDVRVYHCEHPLHRLSCQWRRSDYHRFSA